MEIALYLMENIGFSLLVAIIAIYFDKYISDKNTNK